MSFPISETAAAEKLRLRETALNSISQGVLISDENRKIIYVNNSFTELTGYSESEVLGRNCAFLQGPDSDPETILKMRAALDAGEAFEGEILNYRKDGRPFWNELSISPIRASEAEPLRFIGIQRDVTQRRKAEETMRRNETELQILFDLMPAMIWLKDAENNHLRVNQRVAASVGKPAEEIEGRPAREIYPDEADAFYAADLEIIRSGVPKLGIIETIRDNHGREIWVQADKVPYCDKDGKVIGIVVMAQDITERRLAETALAESEAHYHSLFENMVEGYAFCRLLYDNGRATDFVHLEVNSAFETLTGLKDVVGKKISELVPDIRNSSPDLFEIYSRVVSTGETERFELHHQPTQRWFAITVYSREAGHFVTVFDNITERKRAEEHLAANEALLRQFIQHTPAAIAMLDTDMRYLQVSQRWVEDYHLDGQEIIGRTHYEVFPEVPQRWKDIHQRVLAGAVERCDEEPFPREDGTTDWLQWEARPWHKAGGEIGGLIFFTQVITDRIKAREKERLSAERLQLATRAGGIGIWELDCASGRLTWDDQMFALYGQPREGSDSLSERWTKNLYPEDRARAEAELADALHGGSKSFDTEFRIIRSNDGAIRFIRAIANLLHDESGKAWRMVGTNWDITEERLREQRLAEALVHEKEFAEKARAADHAKSEFLAMMSHEIRTPLSGILGFSELLAQIPTLAPEPLDYAQTIRSCGKTLLRILDDVLDFSRLEAGRMPIEKKVFEPREILRDIHSLLGPQAHDKQLDLRLSIEESIPPFLEGDAGRLRQILLNLAGNALKFTELGSVTLGLRLGREPSHYEFFVRDTGPGIAPEDIEYILEPFNQADSSISRRYGGTGLGLAISRRLAELMGGTLEVHSRPGHGSEFIASVPLGEVALSSHLPDAAASQTFDKRFALHYPLRILVVEDDEVNLKLLTLLLRQLGYAPMAAKDGHEAFEIHQREHPDCILMDLHMPVMDGLEATKKIRSAEKNSKTGAQTFITALTADILPADRQRCLDAGMNTYLNKPVQMAVLAEALIEAVKFRSKAL
jgi:PAS domain S-box-containing protein